MFKILDSSAIQSLSHRIYHFIGHKLFCVIISFTGKCFTRTKSTLYYYVHKNRDWKMKILSCNYKKKKNFSTDRYKISEIGGLVGNCWWKTKMSNDFASETIWFVSLRSVSFYFIFFSRFSSLPYWLLCPLVPGIVHRVRCM